MARKRKEKKTPTQDGVRVLVRNRRARYDYEISEVFEAGIALEGSEVKSLRESRASLGDGYVEIKGGEAWLLNVQINPYPWANLFNHEPRRPRKLLLRREELKRLGVKTAQRGFTIVPLSFYLRRGKIKVEIGLARGKRKYEKRESAREAEAQREIDRALK